MIKTDSQLVALLGGANMITTLEAWKPFLKDAEKLNITSAIGRDLYNYLSSLVKEDDYEDDIEEIATSAEVELLENIRLALINYADLYSTQRLGMTNGDGGKSDTNANYTMSSPKWKYSAALEMSRDKADTYLELALEQLVATPEEFPVYTNSPFFTQHASMLVYSATRFTEFFPNCRNNQHFYLHIREQLKSEQKKTASILGQEFYEEIVLANAKMLKNETVSPETEAVVQLLAKLISHRAVVAAIPYLNIGEDWRYKSRIGGLEDKHMLSDANRSEIKTAESQAADNAKSTLIEYLNTTATETIFPLFFNSTGYVAPTEKEVNILNFFYKNDPEKKYVVL
jgi:hypothetical protein